MYYFLPYDNRVKKAAVVILNWNGKSLLERFLPALLAYTPQTIADIIVADNCSDDDSLNFLSFLYPDIQTIELDKNYGFAEGYNRSIAQLSHEYVILLNSDVEVSDGWLVTAIEYMEKERDVVALQPKILSYRNKSMFEYAGACGGFIDYYGYPFCRGRVMDVVEKDNNQYDEVTEILWASGACLFVRTEAYKQAGGLDATFFAHQEEIDFCWRLVSRGKKIVCLPSSVVYHIGGATLAMSNPQKTYLNFRNNLLMIYKNMPEKYLNKALSIRFFLDVLAALFFLLKRERGNFKAVFRARRDFKKLKKKYKSVRQNNLAQSLPELPKQVYRKSVIFAFYCLNKKRYNDF